jgi:heme/copper-type cytochrome/quinol oxidase subunit 1
MTTIDPSTDALAGAPAGTSADDSATIRFLAAVGDWLTSADSKRIGRLYLAGGGLGLLATAVVNVLLGVERIDGTDAVLDESAWAQLLDAQRIGLVFGAAVPLAMGLCLALVPLQLGARSLAFPRLAAAGLWMWFGGLILNVIALANNGGTLGGDGDMVDLFIASAGALGTSVLTTRAPGMTMRRVPFFAWSALVFALGVLLVMPVLLGTLTYLFVDHRFGDRSAFGGNEGIGEWAGWIVGQPTTFLFAIPALGVFADLLPSTFRVRTPARGVMYGGLALVGVAAFAGVTQQSVQNLPWAGSGFDLDDAGDKFQDLVPYAFFNLLPILGAAIVFVVGLVLARTGLGTRPRITPGFAFAFFGFGMVLVGMVGNAVYAIDDVGLQGTVFDEATLVYVVYGSVLGVLGGFAHWVPKLRGGTMSLGRVLPLALLGVLATVLATFPYYIAGFLDQPTGLSYDDSDLQIWNVLVLVGNVLMILTVLGFVGLALRVRADDDAVDDPWDGQTLEWATTSPAPLGNFAEVPLVGSAEPLLDLKEGAAAPAAAADGGWS